MHPEHMRFTVLGLNPNDVATFIVVLILSAPVLLNWSKHWIWFVGPVEAGLIALLVGTGSRGGVMAFVCGLILLMFLGWRAGSWPKGWTTWTGLVVVFAMGTGVGLVAFPKGSRIGSVDVSPEASAGRRLEVWSSVPAMIAAAPNGWGLGNSAEAYEQWFEPEGENVEFKHLLSSHLTWLVEFGWPMRCLYLFLWMIAFGMLLPNRKLQFPIWGIAVWAAFLVALFYNASGKWWNWPIPALWLLSALIVRSRQRIFPDWRYWMLPAFVSICLVVLPTMLLKLKVPPMPIYSCDSGNIVFINAGEPRAAILGPNKEVLGDFYGQEIRKEEVKSKTPVAVIIHPDAADSAHLKDCHLFVVSGLDETELKTWESVLSPPSGSKLILINCRVTPDDWLRSFKSIDYCLGDFYGDPDLEEWKNLSLTNSTVIITEIPRCETYVAAWWSLLDDGTAREETGIRTGM